MEKNEKNSDKISSGSYVLGEQSRFVLKIDELNYVNADLNDANNSDNSIIYLI